MEAGRRTPSEIDVLVVGGGPAGAAAAITAAVRSLCVVLVERAVFPRHRPGETLHPGAEAVLRQLGVAEAVAAASSIRHEGVHITWPGAVGLQPYGADAGGPWRGYQISRDILDVILIDRARAVGVEVLQPCRAVAAIRSDNGMLGVETTTGVIRARVVVDAGGARGWAARQGIVRQLRCSPRLQARYGYCRLSDPAGDTNPRLSADHSHWSWLAPLSDDIANWTQVAYPNARFRDIDPPEAVTGLAPIGRTRGADVTWRLARPAASDGIIAVGDAASVHDPLSSHGVLHALMSGIMAATVATSAVAAGQSPNALWAMYDDWVKDRFLADSARLVDVYQRLSPVPAWIDQATKRLIRLF